ncbi:MAG: hypothetical protein COA79_01845 [Planctomycetota bacterium]|nr:MAG: hypothetical protein COA79_01845 [Planctomycetota bacterium]
MLDQEQLEIIKKNITDFIEKKNLDVGILMEINAEGIKVIEIFGDPFARPDLKIGTLLNDPGHLYQNEFQLSKEAGNLSNIPTMGMGADCGIRIKSTKYLITFDDVLGDMDMDEESIEELTSLQKKLEDSIHE